MAGAKPLNLDGWSDIDDYVARRSAKSPEFRRGVALGQMLLLLGAFEDEPEMSEPGSKVLSHWLVTPPTWSLAVPTNRPIVVALPVPGDARPGVREAPITASGGVATLERQALGSALGGAAGGLDLSADEVAVTGTVDERTMVAVGPIRPDRTWRFVHGYVFHLAQSSMAEVIAVLDRSGPP